MGLMDRPLGPNMADAQCVVVSLRKTIILVRFWSAYLWVATAGHPKRLDHLPLQRSQVIPDAVDHFLGRNLDEHLGVSINLGTPKWLVFDGQSHENGRFGGAPISGNPHWADF